MTEPAVTSDHPMWKHLRHVADAHGAVHHHHHHTAHRAHTELDAQRDDEAAARAAADHPEPTEGASNERLS